MSEGQLYSKGVCESNFAPTTRAFQCVAVSIMKPNVTEDLEKKREAETQKRSKKQDKKRGGKWGITKIIMTRNDDKLNSNRQRKKRRITREKRQ